MKKLYSILALVLCMVMVAFCFTSCKKDKKGTSTTKPGSSDTGTVEATSDKWESIALEVNDLSAANRTFKIELDNFTSAERTAMNVQYLRGPDAIDSNTSAIQQMVYERNKDAKDLLNLTIEYDTWDKDWNAQHPEIVRLVDASAADAPDLFVNMVFDLNLALKTKGVFRDVYGLPGGYFDFDAKGWMKSWMESYSFTGDRAYVLASDYFLDVMRAMGVLPFNMDLMDERANDLAPAILGEGETLGAGEKLSERFFDFVEMGGFTWSVLGKLCEAVHVDADGNGQDNLGDVLGIMVDSYSGMQPALIVFSAGETLTETYPDETKNKDWIKLKDNSVALGAIFEAVKGVFEGKGSLVTSGGAKGATVDNPGIAYTQTKFAEKTLLFAGPTLLGALENDTFQQMESTYSVVPMPKVYSAKAYSTIVHNTADCGAINVKSSLEKAKAISAFLQYTAEHSGDIREEFLQIVTKYRTTTYNQGTDRMLDVIYDSLSNSRDKGVEDASMGKAEPRFHGVMKENGYVWGRSDVVSWYETNRSSKQDAIDELLETWYNLPTNADIQPTAE